MKKEIHKVLHVGLCEMRKINQNNLLKSNNTHSGLEDFKERFEKESKTIDEAFEWLSKNS
jgi:hypothetical protein